MPSKPLKKKGNKKKATPKPVLRGTEVPVRTTEQMVDDVKDLLRMLRSGGRIKSWVLATDTSERGNIAGEVTHDEDGDQLLRKLAEDAVSRLEKRDEMGRRERLLKAALLQ